MAVAAPQASAPPFDVVAQETIFAQAVGEVVPARLALAAQLGSGLRGQLLLWLFAHDPNQAVRLAAAQNAVRRCAGEQAPACAALLRPFLRAKETPASASALARAELARRLPEAALVHAPASFRLQMVAGATAELGAPARSQHAARLLRRLAEDDDLEVQQAAAAALMTLER